ncbi:UDP-4-amino-4,6-dideoxy-N-acetyl-beta-L-altrosamine transaminase [compost metagenome]
MIPYGRQDVNEQDIQAVVEVLKSDWLTQGPAVPRFEAAVSAFCGAEFAVATSNATAALHIACLALGLGPQDTLWTTPNTFVATANCARYCGASVDFVDIDPRTYNMSVAALRAKLEIAEKNGALPKIVIPVHFAGQSCEMREIKALAEKYNFAIIEDASHAVGGSYLGAPVGNGRYSDITIFSFHPVKIITTGEGGMAVTNNPQLAERLRLFRSHGITSDPEKMPIERDGVWHYQQIELGYNYRMTDLQAALGASQTDRLEQFCARRYQIAQQYETLLDALPVIKPYQHPDTHSSYHLYPIRCPLTEKADRKAVFDGFRDAEILVNVHYIPVHLQPYYRKLGFKLGDFPEAERYYSEAISLPIYAKLADEQQLEVVSTLKSLLGAG